MNPHELPTPRTEAATFYRHANEACVLAEVCEQIEQEAAAWKGVAEWLAHYVKAARRGDSPLIHSSIVEMIDNKLEAFDALKAGLEGRQG